MANLRQLNRGSARTVVIKLGTVWTNGVSEASETERNGILTVLYKCIARLRGGWPVTPEGKPGSVTGPREVLGPVRVQCDHMIITCDESGARNARRART